MVQVFCRPFLLCLTNKFNVAFVEVNNPEAAQATPPKAAGLSYANLSTLLRAAGNREPSSLELKLIELLFPLSPSNTVDKAHLAMLFYISQ